MRNSFSTFDIVKALGIPRERLKDWQSNEFIEATDPAEGQGTKATFTLADVYCVALFQELLISGFKRAFAAGWLKNFRKHTYKIEEVVFIAITTKFSEGKRSIHSKGFAPLPPNYHLVPQYAKETTSPILKTFYPVFRRLEKVAISLKGEKISFFERLKDIQKREEWDHLHIINFKAIRDRVDKALSILGD